MFDNTPLGTPPSREGPFGNGPVQICHDGVAVRVKVPPGEIRTAGADAIHELFVGQTGDVSRADVIHELMCEMEPSEIRALGCAISMTIFETPVEGDVTMMREALFGPAVGATDAGE